MNEFINTYRSWTNEQIVDAFKQRSNYQEEAGEAMKIVLTERGLTEDLKKLEVDYPLPKSIYNVGYKKYIGSIFMVVALFILGTSLYTGHYFPNVILGLLFIFLAFRYLNSKAIEYDDDEIRMKNLFGSVVARRAFVKDKIEVRNGTIYGNGKKINASVSMLNTDEFQNLIKFIEAKPSL